MSISGDIVQHIEHPGGICVSLELACGVEYLGLLALTCSVQSPGS